LVQELGGNISTTSEKKAGHPVERHLLDASIENRDLRKSSENRREPFFVLLPQPRHYITHASGKS
jgi:hypothetical protein